MIELKLSDDFRASFFALGARIQGIWTPDKHGRIQDVVLGYDTEREYLEKHMYHGAVCGRYANRIGGASFSIDGKSYNVVANDGRNCLHGGSPNLSELVWKVEEVSDTSVLFSYLSKAGEAGFPGSVQFWVRYSLTSDHSLHIQFNAETDAPTPINLTCHPYFNLSGEGASSCLDHLVQIHADSIVEVDVDCIPTGAYAPVYKSPFDFNTPKPIGQHINSQDQQLMYGNGYDHCFVTNQQLQAKVVDPHSGRTLEVYSSYPGVQFYTANWLGETGKKQHLYKQRSAFCLEPQFYPDAPNHNHFPNTILRPGEKYEHEIRYTFGTTNFTP
ncbi:MAG: galactose mutarotase [Saprospiraceae bacterium]|nr:galactose mutarotase [Saprospiraceae bacterium]